MSIFVLFFAHVIPYLFFFFFFNDTATTEIYTLSLHDALPIFLPLVGVPLVSADLLALLIWATLQTADRKSTRLNSSHLVISYAVFCLKKKKKTSVPAHSIEYTESQHYVS